MRVYREGSLNLSGLRRDWRWVRCGSHIDVVQPILTYDVCRDPMNNRDSE